MADKRGYGPTARIWLTSRSRMEANSRYSFYDTISHIVLTYYSVLLLAIAIFSNHFRGSILGTYLDEIRIVLAICILAAGLVIWNLKFGQTARQHEECYHELERIFSSKQSDEEKLIEYDAVKKRYPNHAQYDYETVLFQKIIMGKEKLINSRGKKISFGYKRIIRHLFYWSVYRFIAFALFLPGPILIAISMDWF